MEDRGFEGQLPAAWVVVVHWDQPRACQATLDAFARSPGVHRVTVVDNGSTPANIATLRRIVGARHGVELVELGANRGFGPAANVGLRRWLARRGPDWAVVVPHDALPDPSTLVSLLHAGADRPELGLMCADVGDGAVPVVDPYLGAMCVAPAGAVGSTGLVEVDYPHGTLMGARRACLAEVGLFDERYFAYCEEADLGIRARSAGWRVGLLRGAAVRNPTMRSGAAVVDYLMQRNTLLLVHDHFGRYRAVVRLAIAVGQLAAGVSGRRRSAFVFSARGRCRGLVDFCRGRSGAPPASMFRGRSPQGLG